MSPGDCGQHVIDASRSVTTTGPCTILHLVLGLLLPFDSNSYHFQMHIEGKRRFFPATSSILHNHFMGHKSPVICDNTTWINHWIWPGHVLVTGDVPVSNSMSIHFLPPLSLPIDKMTPKRDYPRPDSSLESMKSRGSLIPDEVPISVSLGWFGTRNGCLEECEALDNYAKYSYLWWN